MKHLLNNISEEEKNSIREQHKGGMKVMNEKFQKMVNKQLGHVNLYEQTSQPEDSGENEYRKNSGIKLPAIKSEEDLKKFLELNAISVGSLAKALTGKQMDSNSKYGAKSLNIFQELLKRIAMFCDNDGECYNTVKYSNLVDNFFEKMKNENDKVENSSELVIYPKKPGYLTSFKGDLATKVRNRIMMLNKS